VGEEQADACLNDDYTKIWKEAECEDAAGDLGLTYEKGVYLKNRPSGCYKRSSKMPGGSESAFFNVKKGAVEKRCAQPTEADISKGLCSADDSGYFADRFETLCIREVVDAEQWVTLKKNAQAGLANCRGRDNQGAHHD